MKHLYILFLITPLFFSSCNDSVPCPPPEPCPPAVPCPIIDKSQAKVDAVNNLLVFIKSKPFKAYELYDEPVVRSSAEEIVNSGKKKKGLLKTLGGLAEGVVKNLSFQEQLNTMTELTLKMYPDADGVIFKNKLDQCFAFKFKEEE